MGIHSLTYQINNGSFQTPQSIPQYTYKKPDGTLYIEPEFSKEFGRKFFGFITFAYPMETTLLPSSPSPRHHGIHRKASSNSLNIFADKQFQRNVMDECIFFVESATLVCFLNYPEIPIAHLLSQALTIINFVCCVSGRAILPILHKQIFIASLSIAFKLNRDQTIATSQLLDHLNLNQNSGTEITVKEILAIENQITQAFHVNNISVYTYVEAVMPWFERGHYGITDEMKRQHLASLILTLVEVNPFFKQSQQNSSAQENC